MSTTKLEDVLQAELTDILRRRKCRDAAADLESKEPDGLRDVRDLPDSFALACSGGGIRSAAVCSGVVCALADAGLFHQLDYLSSVSGGGYLSSSVLARLNSEISKDVEMANLDAGGNGAAGNGVDDDCLVKDPTSVAKRHPYNAIALKHVNIMAKNCGYIFERPMCKSVCGFFASLINLLTFPTVFGLVALDHLSTLLLGAVIFAEAINYVVTLVLPGDTSVSDDVKKLSVKAFQILGIASSAGGTFLFILLAALGASNWRASPWVNAIRQILRLLLAMLVSVWCVGVLLYFDISWNSTVWDEIFQIAASGVAVLCLLSVAVSGSSSAVVAVGGVLSIMNPVCVLLGLWCVARLVVASEALRNVSADEALHTFLTSSGWNIVLAVCFVVCVIKPFVELVVPWSSLLHYYYSKRLAGAFYPSGKDFLLTAADTKAIASSWCCRCCSRRRRTVPLTQGPYYLCNTTVNDIAPHPYSANRELTGEATYSEYMLSPLFYGCDRLGYLPTTPAKDRPYCEPLPLEAAMGMSGAAVSLAMGNYDTGSVGASRLRVLMTLLGASMGSWARLRPYKPYLGIRWLKVAFNLSVHLALCLGMAVCVLLTKYRYFALVLACIAAALLFASMLPVPKCCCPKLIKRALANLKLTLLSSFAWVRLVHLGLGVVATADAPPPLLYLSDGGHSENLGLFEMLKRQVKFIISVDTGADPKVNCDSFKYALRRAQDCLGCSFLPWAEDGRSPFDLPHAIRSFQSGDHANTPAHRFLKLTVKYPLRDAEGAVRGYSTGTLWYIKSSPKPVPDLSPATPSDPFPDNSTGNQFFDRALFESYARLGHIYAKAVCTDILADGNWARRAQREVRAFDLRDAPPHPVGGFPHVNPIVIVHDANREVPSPL